RWSVNAQVDRKDAWRSRPIAIRVGEAGRSAALTENPLPSRDESAHPERTGPLRLVRRGIGSWSRSPTAQQARAAGARKGYPRIRLAGRDGRDRPLLRRESSSNRRRKTGAAMGEFQGKWVP